MLSTNESSFLAFGFELIIYGIYIVLFILALICLTWRRKRESIHKFYLFFCCFLFSCCSIHVFIKFRYTYKDLSEKPNPTGALETGTPTLRVADALVTLIDFFAQIVWIYRCWSVWQRKFSVIILPVLLSLGFLACAITGINGLIEHPNAAIAPTYLVPLGIAIFILPVIFNFMITTLIIGRIWYQGRQRQMAIRGTNTVVSHNQRYIYHAMGVVIEAGVLYLLVQLVLAVLFAIHHPAQLLVAGIAVQVYGIAPTMIFVRVSLGHSFSFVGQSDNTAVNVPSTTSKRRSRPGMISITKTVESQINMQGSGNGQSFDNYELSPFDSAKISGSFPTTPLPFRGEVLTA